MSMDWGKKTGSTEVGGDKGQVYVTVTGTEQHFFGFLDLTYSGS